MPPMHVLVTGASSGIGASIAGEYLGRGARVTLVARRRDRLEAIAARAAARSHVIAADLADHARVPAIASEARGPTSRT
jgi:short-subunit dehydrogenase